MAYVGHEMASAKAPPQASTGANQHYLQLICFIDTTWGYGMGVCLFVHLVPWLDVLLLKSTLCYLVKDRDTYCMLSGVVLLAMLSHERI